MDHIYIAYLRLYFLNYLDSYRYAPKLRHVSSAIAETAETADVELDQEKWPDDVPDLKQEVWPTRFRTCNRRSGMTLCRT